MENKPVPMTFIIGAISLFFLCANSFAADEILKTSKVKVGEKAPLTETLKRANSEGKVILLVLFPSPLGCRKCDTLVSLLQEEATLNKEAAFILKGGEDLLGATDEETFLLKRNYGFVTMGAAWSFVIDREGVLRKILIGSFDGEELKRVLDEIGRRKE